MIALGERRELDFDLAVEAVAEVVKVTAEANPLISPDRMGSSQEIPEAEIKSLPTIRRQFQDFARTNPYVNVQPNDPTQTTISIAGKNNRYNSIQIDGAVNNDLFGLAATGTPGGQTDTASAGASRGCTRRRSKTIFYYDINKIDSGARTFYGAPIYKNLSTAFSDMILLSNTTKGDQENVVLQLVSSKNLH